MIFIGIDPGLGGGIAAVDSDGDVSLVADAPTVTTYVKNKKREEFDLPEMGRILHGIVAKSGGQTLAQIERVGTMPEQGISSAFNFGKGYGFWIGMLVANFIRYEEVHPLTWKKAMLSGMGSKGQGANKKVPSMLKAQQLFPKYAHLLFSEWRGKRYPKDGRAEALLMAEHSRQRHFGLMRVTEVPARKRRAIKADVATDVNRAEAEGLQAKDDAVRAEDTISKKDGGNQ